MVRRRKSPRSLFFKFLGEVAEASVAPMAQSAAAPKKRRRRAKGAADCTPCAAMDKADKVRARVREGKLL